MIARGLRSTNPGNVVLIEWTEAVARATASHSALEPAED